MKPHVGSLTFPSVSVAVYGHRQWEKRFGVLKIYGASISSRVQQLLRGDRLVTVDMGRALYGRMACLRP